MLAGARAALMLLLLAWQEIFRPDIFWYSAPTQIQLPFNIVGLLAFELFTMHWCAAHRATGPASGGTQLRLQQRASLHIWW